MSYYDSPYDDPQLMGMMNYTSRMLGRAKPNGGISDVEIGRAERARDRATGKAIGTGIGAVGYLGGPAAGALTMAGGGMAGEVLGNNYKESFLKDAFDDKNKLRKLVKLGAMANPITGTAALIPGASSVKKKIKKLGKKLGF